MSKLKRDLETHSLQHTFANRLILWCTIKLQQFILFHQHFTIIQF